MCGREARGVQGHSRRADTKAETPEQVFEEVKGAWSSES